MNHMGRLAEGRIVASYAHLHPSGLADKAADQSGARSFLARPAVVCSCSLGFSSIAPLQVGAGLASLGFPAC